MVARQEEMRRKTAEHEAELRTRTELAKAKAEAEGRIAQERANHDLILEKVKLEAAERRDTVLKAIADGGKLIGEGLATYIDDTEKLRNTALAVTGIAAGVYAAKTGIGIGGRFVEVSKGTKAFRTDRVEPFAAQCSWRLVALVSLFFVCLECSTITYCISNQTIAFTNIYSDIFRLDLASLVWSERHRG